MKRQLSLVLALVMILGSFSAVFAADATVEETAGAFLAKNGVLSGYAGSNDLGLEDNLLRQDTLVLVARLLGEFDEAKAHEGEVTYEDVKDPTYVPLAAWARENETFVGHTDAKFGFGENLTAQEYAKVLLVALDYTVGPNGDKDVNWNNVLTKAKDLGLLADVEVENATEITRGQMAVMTFNALGTNLKGKDETLADKLGIEMPEADELKVEEVYTENLAEIVVELSNAKLAKNKEALTNPNNYRLDDSDIKVHNVDVEGNDLVLTLVPYGKVDDQKDVKALVKGKEYKLTVRNIEKISETIKFTAKDNAVPTVEKVEVLGTHGIKVTTSEPVNNPQERNFKIADKRTSMIIEQYGRELVLTPYHKSAFDKDAETLVILELEDFEGYRSATSIEKLDEVADDGTPEVVKAYRNGKKLTLVFDRDVYRKSVKPYESRRDEGNVSFVERRVTFYAETANKVDTNVVEYEFEREIPRDAIVTVQGVQNHNEKAMVKQDVETTLFDDDYAPVVISKLSVNVESTDVQEKDKVTKSTKGLKVEFDKDIKELVDALTNEVKDAKKAVKDAEDADKDAAKANLRDLLEDKLKVDDFFKVYELEVSKRGEKNEVKVVIEDIESDSITVSFADAYVNNKNRDYDYVLEVSSFNDNNRNRMVREYIDFQVVPKGTDFKVAEAVVATDVRGNVEVVIEFNKSVKKSEAEDARNYFFGDNGNDLIVDEAIVERDGKTVSLVIKDTTVAKLIDKYEDRLEISPRVTDLDDNKLEDRVFFIKTAADLAADVKAVEKLITELPALDELDNEEAAKAVKEARDAYDKLNPREQKKVSNLDALKAAEAKIKELEDEEKAEDDVKAANLVLEGLTNLMTSASDLEAKKAALVEVEAKATEIEAAKKLADELVVSKFNVALAELKSDIEAADALAKAQKAVADAQEALDNAIAAAKAEIDEDHEAVVDEKAALEDAKTALANNDDEDEEETLEAAVTAAQEALDNAIAAAKAEIDEDHEAVADEKVALDKAKEELAKLQ